MRQRAFFIMRIYLLVVTVFVIAKVCFMIYHSGAHPFSAADMLAVISHGLLLDLSTAIYLTILPFLVAVISLWWDGWPVLRNIVRVYYGIAAVSLSLIFVSDTSLYEFWGFKLNASVLAYLETPQGITASVSWWYIALRLVVVAMSGWLIYKCFTLATPRSLPSLALRRRVMSTVVALLLIGPIVIGIRGGVTEATTNIGQVYFSQVQYLNHAAVNPFFCFMSSFEHGAEDYDIYDFYDEQTCLRLTDGIYTTESLDADTLLTTPRPNVVIILLESCGGTFTEIGGRSDIMPNLNRLAHEGVYFTQCYGNSWRTDRGTVCALSGYPSFPNASVMKMPDKSRTMPSVAATLRREGYATSYLYGGDINFTNMRSYLISTGWEQLTSMEHYTKAEQRSAQWGVRDDITFGTLREMIEAGRKTGRPFLIGYSTLSSHEPWDVPTHTFDDEVLNAFSYLDNCIGSFIDSLRPTPAWQDLLIVLIPDHGITYKDIDNTRLLRNHIPMIWVGGAVRRPVEVDRICNQTDLPATLLGQMGIGHGDFTFSRDVLSSTYCRRMAMNTFSNGFMLTDSTGYIVYDLDAGRFSACHTADSARLLTTGKAILQMTSKDLKNR